MKQQDETSPLRRLEKLFATNPIYRYNFAVLSDEWCGVSPRVHKVHNVKITHKPISDTNPHMLTLIKYSNEDCMIALHCLMHYAMNGGDWSPFDVFINGESVTFPQTVGDFQKITAKLEETLGKNGPKGNIITIRYPDNKAGRRCFTYRKDLCLYLELPTHESAYFRDQESQRWERIAEGLEAETDEDV